MRIRDWSSDVCSSDLAAPPVHAPSMPHPSSRGRCAVGGMPALFRHRLRTDTAGDAGGDPEGGNVIDKFTTVYPGHIDLGDMGQNAKTGRAACRERVCK